MKNRGDITPPKQHNNFTVTYPKEMEIKKTARQRIQNVLRKLSKLYLRKYRATV